MNPVPAAIMLLALFGLAVGPLSSQGGEYRVQAQALRELDLRQGVLDVKYDVFRGYRSEEKPDFFKYDPFVIPSTIPSELLPDQGVRTQPSAILASSVAKVALGFRTQFDVVGVMGFDGQLFAVIQQRGTPFSNLFAPDARLGPFQADGFFNPETQTMRFVMGVAQVVTVAPALVQMRFGAYFQDDPIQVVWRVENFYLRSDFPF